MTEQVTEERIAEIRRYAGVMDKCLVVTGMVRDLLLYIDTVQAERDEAQRRLSAAKGEVDFHQQRTVFFEVECARLRAQSERRRCRRPARHGGCMTKPQAPPPTDRDREDAASRPEQTETKQQSVDDYVDSWSRVEQIRKEHGK